MDINNPDGVKRPRNGYETDGNIKIVPNGRKRYLFNEVTIFIFKFENQSGSEYTQNMYRNTSKFEGSRQTLKKLSIYFNDFSANIYSFKVVIKTWV